MRRKLIFFCFESSSEQFTLNFISNIDLILYWARNIDKKSYLINYYFDIYDKDFLTTYNNYIFQVHINLNIKNTLSSTPSCNTIFVRYKIPFMSDIQN